MSLFNTNEGGLFAGGCRDKCFAWIDDMRLPQEFPAN